MSEKRMRFFTRAWCTGELDDRSFEEALGDYWRHVAEISPRLSPTTRLLAQHLNLHDARFKSVIVEPDSRRAELHLRCGDLQVGYFDLTLMYGNASVAEVERGSDSVAIIVSDHRTEILYDEVTIAEDGFIEHNLLCWPQGEICIRYSDLSVSVRDAP